MIYDRGNFLCFLIFFLVTHMPYALAITAGKDPRVQALRSYNLLLHNVSPPDALPGTVIASPSRHHPNYYYHWVRDASLVMKLFSRFARDTDNAREQQNHIHRLQEYAAVTRVHQQHPAPAGLGEVKFYADGRPFVGPWGRPQNDGPALRAIALIDLAEYFIIKGEQDYVLANLYDGRSPSDSVIKRDLEYVAAHWREPSFDIWEEVLGDHFFTRLSQHRALKRGARLAQRLGDLGAARWYRMQADELAEAIDQHWDQDRGYFVATLHRRGGLDYKTSNLDSSVVLAVVVRDERQEDSLIALDDYRIMNTALQLIRSFADLYPINRRFPDLSPGIGRYPEDRFDGYRSDAIGNPWFPLTAAFATYFYKLAAMFTLAGALEITNHNLDFLRYILLAAGHPLLPQAGERYEWGEDEFEVVMDALRQMAEGFIARVLFHTDSDGHMSEQFNRNTGFMQGARDLSASHASYLQAIHTRSLYHRALLMR